MNGPALLSRPGQAAASSDGDEKSPNALQPVTRSADAGRWLVRVEWITVALLTLVAIALQIRFVTAVGGLWRDETNSINLATLPTFADVWRFLDYDSFPVLYFAVLRAWSGIFGAGNDEALRVLGLLIGLSILGALWANARAFGHRLPLLSLALVGLNPMIVRYGDSNRAYGLGILLILLTLRSFWRLAERPSAPSAKEVTIAAVLAVLSVQCLYYNAVLLLAIAAGAAAVALRAKAWRTVGTIIGIGALAAASLLPYAPIIIRMRAWTFLVSYPATFSWLWKRAGEVMGSPEPAAIWLWVSLVVIGLGTTLVALLLRRGSPARVPAAVLFGAIALVVGVAGYATFLRALNYYTQPWYYVTLAAFAACTLDIILGASPMSGNHRVPAIILRCLRPSVALGLLCFAAPLTWYDLQTRHTNVDLIASQFQKFSRKGDVIVIPRWECAISFCRYYHGQAEVLTIPPIADHRFHRYDLVLTQMKTKDAERPVLDRMEKTLRTGHRVFLADALPFPAADAPLPTLRPPHKDQSGAWHGDPYYAVWNAYAGRFLRAHATHAGRIEVPLPPGIKVQKFEELDPGVVAGWQ